MSTYKGMKQKFRRMRMTHSQNDGRDKGHSEKLKKHLGEKN